MVPLLVGFRQGRTQIFRPTQRRPMDTRSENICANAVVDRSSPLNRPTLALYYVE